MLESSMLHAISPLVDLSHITPSFLTMTCYSFSMNGAFGWEKSGGSVFLLIPLVHATRFRVNIFPKQGVAGYALAI